MERKVIFLDVDGTLVDYHNQLPASAITAVKRARQKGHLVFVCTGRSKAEMQKDIWEMGIDGMIGGNGSYIEYRGEVIYHEVIPNKKLETIKSLKEKISALNDEVANFKEKAQPALREYMLGKGKSTEEVAHLKTDDVMHGLVYGGELYRDDLNKVSFVLSSYQDHLDSKVAFPNLKAGTWGGRGESALFGDLGVKDIDKAQAIRRILAHLGASQKDTIAFGDAKVDIPMLDYCAVGVAMGNGGPEILAMADMITDDVEHDGLYKAFEQLGLLDD